MCKIDLDDRTIAVIGLGYVGLPLAVEFGRIRPRQDRIIPTVGHDRFAAMGAAAIRRLGREGAVFCDVKGIFAEHETDGRL